MITFDIPEKAIMMQLLGSNGFGKSSLIRTFKCGIYGETEGIVMSDIANSVNGNCVLIHTIIVKNNKWRIERGFSPNYVKVYIGDNDKPEEYGSIDAVKNKIKKEIVDIPYYVFASVLSLSINDFKSFITMKPSDSKNIRDRIFGFFPINEIYNTVNSELLALEKEYDMMKNALEVKKEGLQNLETQYTQMKETASTQIKEQLSKLKTDFETKNKLFETKKTEIEEAKTELNRITGIVSYIKNLEIYRTNQILEEQIEAVNKVITDTDSQLEALDKQHKEILLADANYDKYQRYVESEKARTDIKEIKIKLEEDKALSEKYQRRQLVTEIYNKFSDLSQLRAKLETLTGKKQKLQGQIDTAKKHIDSHKQTIADSKAGIDVVSSKIELYKKGTCPECDTDLTDGDHKHKLAVYETKLADHNTALETSTLKKQSLEDQLAKANEVMAGYNQQETTLNIELKKLVEYLADRDYDTFATEYNNLEPVDVSFDLVVEHNTVLKRISKAVGDIARLEAKLVDYKFDKAIKRSDTKAADIEEQIQVLKTTRNNSVSQKDIHTRSLVKLTDDFDPSLDVGILTQDDISTAATKIDSLNTEKTEMATDLRNMQAKSKELKTQLEDNSIKHMENMLNEAKASIENDEAVMETKLLDINYKKIQKHSLSDDGIKAAIIKEYVPFINKQIQKVLDNFEIGLSLYFDSEFKAHVFRIGKEVSIKTTSTGQKKILDFAILIAMTKILKLKYPDINLIFYDEIFSSIHPSNRVIILDIIKNEIVEGMNMNVVVVSHTHLPEYYFEKFIEIYRDNGFSKVKQNSAA